MTTDLKELEGVEAKLDEIAHELVQAQGALKKVEKELALSRKYDEEKSATILSLNNEKASLKGLLTSLHQEVEALKSANSLLTEELKNSHEETHVAIQEANENKAYIVLRTRARPMKKVLDGKSGGWNPQGR